MYTLTLLDYTAELAELTYDLGTAVRRRFIPALVAMFVVIEMAIQAIRTRKFPKELAQWLTALPQETPEEPKPKAVQKPAYTKKAKRRASQARKAKTM